MVEGFFNPTGPAPEYKFIPAGIFGCSSSSILLPSLTILFVNSGLGLPIQDYSRIVFKTKASWADTIKPCAEPEANRPIPESIHGQFTFNMGPVGCVEIMVMLGR